MDHVNDPALPKAAETPWPPGVNWRILLHRSGVQWFQLRPGASTPADHYLVHEHTAITRGFCYGVIGSRN